MNPGFTPAEKQVLRGLVEHPTLNDRELSERIGVKPSTTTAIRRRLRERDVFRTVRIPMGHKLGYEILAVAYGKLKPSLEEKHKKAFRDWVKDIPYVFLSLASSDSILNLAYLKNYSMFREYADAITDMFKHSDLVDHETWVAVIFSMDACKLFRFFDYAPAVRHAFGIEEKAKVDIKFQELSCERLSKKERSVLLGLTKYPESSDKAVAEKIGASRQAVSSMKKRFEEIGVMKTVRIVDLEQIGYGILGVAHSVFTPHATVKVRQEGIKLVQETIPSILNIGSNPENILVAPAKDYDEYHMMKKGALELYSRKGFLRSEPRMTLFPFSDMTNVKDFDFSGFMEVVASEEPES
jgi:DNA-binding MarR family transcriptional regulator